MFVCLSARLRYGKTVVASYGRKTFGIDRQWFRAELEPGHEGSGYRNRVSCYGRVGSRLGSKLYMSRPGVVNL